MNDRVLAMCELSNDLLFHKIRKEYLSYYIDKSLEQGIKIAKKFQGKNIEEIYGEEGISIDYLDSGKGSYGVVLRGQATMSSSECRVSVYQESIRELAKYSCWEGECLTYKQALHVHLAHEFYHFWEYKNGVSIVAELLPVERFSILGWKKYAQINKCCEIAAHAFAKEMTGIPLLPNLYDYLYLIQTEKMTSEDFQKFIDRMCELI